MVSDPATQPTGGLRAAQAESGRWHLTGERSCFSANMAQARLADPQPLSATPDRTRDADTEQWCYYCKKEAEIARLEAENDRLREHAAYDALVAADLASEEDIDPALAGIAKLVDHNRADGTATKDTDSKAIGRMLTTLHRRLDRNHGTETTGTARALAADCDLSGRAAGQALGALADRSPGSVPAGCVLVERWSGGGGRTEPIRWRVWREANDNND